MSRIDEKLVGEGSETRSRWPPYYSRYQREGWGPGSPLSPHFLGWKGGGEGDRSGEERVAGLSEAEPLAKGPSRGGGGRALLSQSHPGSSLTLPATAIARSPGTHPRDEKGTLPPRARLGRSRRSPDARQGYARPQPRGRKAPARGQAAPKVTPEGQHGAAAAPRTSHPAQAGDATIPASPTMALPPLSPSLPQPASTLARHRRRRSWGDAPFVF